MDRLKFLLGLILILFISAAAMARIPRTLSYQGILTDNSGKPRPDGDYQFTFCLYDTATGGAPIWIEQKTLPVKGGLFSTILGDATPFGAAVKFDKPYWLGIRVGNEPELSPRIPLTSVGYSLNAVRADTANVATTSLGDTTWRNEGANIYRLNGNIGIGTTPVHATKLSVYGAGLVGTPFVNGNILNLSTSGAQGSPCFGKLNASEASFIQSSQTGAANHSVLNPEGGNVGIGSFDQYAKLDVAGRTKTQVLEITGGSDFAKPFEISHADSLPVGSLVVIDPEQPGKLKQATEP